MKLIQTKTEMYKAQDVYLKTVFNMQSFHFQKVHLWL